MAMFITNTGQDYVCRYSLYFGENILVAFNNLVQKDILTVSQYYIVEFFLSNFIKPIGSPNPSFVLKSFENEVVINTTGQHYFILKAKQETFLANIKHNIILIGQTYGMDINYVRIRPVPTYSLKKCSDNSVVKVFAPADLTQGNIVISPTRTDYDNYIKLDFDLSAEPEDVYYIEFEDEGVVYVTDTFDLKLEHKCTIQLEWGGTSNAFNFNYSTLDYSQSLRVDAKLWKPNYSYDKNEIFRDSKGVRILNYIRQDRAKTLTIAEMPEYCHNALSLGTKHDVFAVDGAEYVFEEEDYSPNWRKSSENASVEIEIKRQDENLANSNCN